jgi:hypothetical protein
MAMKKENLAAKSQTLTAMNSLSADALFAPAECRRLMDNHQLHIRVGTATQLGAGSTSGDNTRTLRATSAINPTNHRALEGDGEGEGDKEESVGFVVGYLGPDLGNAI